MEKRKLLLVAVSVGVFLVIVLSAGILIFTPGRAAIARPIPAGESSSGTVVNPRLPASADAADMVRNTEDLQNLRVPPPGVFPPGSDSSSPPSVSISAIQENNPPSGGESSPPVPAAEPNNGDPAQVVISVPKPSAPGVPAPSVRPSSGSPAVSQTKAAGQGSSSPSGSRPAPSAPNTAGSQSGASSGSAVVKPSGASVVAVASNPSGPSVVQAAPAKASPSAASGTRAPAIPVSSRPKARLQQDYWIQTGAFSALVRAEDAKEILASKGLAPIIDDREVDGQTWYRVRVGPYTSENEANYWLALVRAIDGFDQSQVRSSQR